jgi:quinol monooxygenase YgiN
MSITINAILKAKQGKEELLRSELLKVIGPSRAEEGCLNYSLHESTENNSTFVFYETWKNEESVKHHIETKHYKQYRQNTETLIEQREVYRLKMIDS